MNLDFDWNPLIGYADQQISTGTPKAIFAPDRFDRLLIGNPIRRLPLETFARIADPGYYVQYMMYIYVHLVHLIGKKEYKQKFFSGQWENRCARAQTHLPIRSAAPSDPAPVMRPGGRRVHFLPDRLPDRLTDQPITRLPLERRHCYSTKNDIARVSPCC